MNDDNITDGKNPAIAPDQRRERIVHRDRVLFIPSATSGCSTTSHSQNVRWQKASLHYHQQLISARRERSRQRDRSDITASAEKAFYSA
jgi:hypothetical protein